MTRKAFLGALNLALLAACGGETSQVGDPNVDAGTDGMEGIDATGTCFSKGRPDGGAVCGWNVKVVGDPAICRIPTDAGLIPPDVCNQLCGPDSQAHPTKVCYWNPPGTLLCGPGCAGRRPAGLGPNRSTADNALAKYFVEMAYLEAASIPAFHILSNELAAHGAPADLRRAMRVAAEDEVRHARMARLVAERFGGVVRAPIVARGPVRTLFEVALENAIEGCVGETWGALQVAWQAKHADPSLRSMFATIARDEAEHALLGWRIAAWAESGLTRDERKRVEAARACAIQSLVASLKFEPDASLLQTAGLPRSTHALQMARALFDDLRSCAA